MKKNIFLRIPELTTATGIRDNSSKSAETSMDSLKSLCTPPMPPVANTLILAALAAIIVVETVVPPTKLLSLEPRTYDKSRRDILIAFLCCLAIVSISCLSNPTLSFPFINPIVAGITYFKIILINNKFFFK
jgi:hypothetical protein